MSTTSPNPAPAESIPTPPIDPELPPPLSMGDVMRIPMMRRLWYSQVISVFGDFLPLFAVITLMFFALQKIEACQRGEAIDLIAFVIGFFYFSRFWPKNRLSSPKTI